MISSLWFIIPSVILAAIIVAVMVFFMLQTKLTKNAVGVDDMVGEKCVVVEKIDTFAGCGLVKVRGQIWSAKGISSDEIFDVGDTLVIIGIEGVRLICKKNA